MNQAKGFKSRNASPANKALRAELEAMSHGADLWETARILNCRAEDIVDFSANINPFIPRDILRRAAEEAIAKLDRYPEAEAESLAAALADKYKLDQKKLLLGNGGADLIFRIAHGISLCKGNKGRHDVMVTAPTFSEYAQAFAASGFEIRHHYLCEREGFQITERILEELSGDLAVLILCEPNNPTGRLTETGLLRKIALQAAENEITLMLDLSFVDFLPEKKQRECQLLLEELPAQPIFLHSFTKFYAIPGLRLGWAEIHSRPLLAKLKKLTPPWQISGPAIAAGTAALGFSPEVEANWRREIEEEKKYMARALEESGAILLGGEVNFLFFQHPDPDFQLRLLREGRPPCLLRSCANYPGLGPGYFRAGIQHPEKNRLLCKNLQKLYGR